jgi:hypothetical protein
VQGGRAAWQQGAFAKTRSDGSYRFGGLPDGQYELYTMPELDANAAAALIEPGKSEAADRWGYPTVFYPDAREVAGAQAITVAHGAEVQANFSLTREPFEEVEAQVTLPQGAAEKAGSNYGVQVLDSAGHELPYPARYDQGMHLVQAALPEGSYSLLVQSVSDSVSVRMPLSPYSGTFSIDGQLVNLQNSEPLEGTVDFAVAGHAVTGLRVPLAAPAFAPVDVTVNRSGTATATTENNQISVMVSPAGASMGGAMQNEYASGTLEGQLKASVVPPGTYWVHTYLSGSGLCEQSFTGGGANLAREPLTVGLAGVTTPMELTLGDDCAQLTLQLPESLAGLAAGIEPFYTTYVVPDFDSTRDVNPVVLRPSVNTSFTLNDLTPGNYHVYTIAGDAQLEYRNADAVAALAGQAVTLGPGASETLVLEAPGQ